MTSDHLRGTIERSAVLRGAVKSRPGQQLVQTVRGARAVRAPLRFMALQLAGARTARHRLRGSNIEVLLRHRTRDINILNEIFGGTAARSSYEPPRTVAAALDANPAPSVLDLGGNIGLFGVYVLSRWPGASIRSFEPDPWNLRVLQSVIAANRLADRWSVAEAAVADRAGRLTFVSGMYADSHLSADADQRTVRPDAGAERRVETISVRAIDIFAERHDVDLMKIDIEGGEWAILTDVRLRGLQADFLVLEWHRRGCPEPDARAAAMSLLRRAGYEQLEEIEHGPDNGLLWAWREQPRATLLTRELTARGAGPS
jgi:FkbM family methyltransferase